jgi:hypothetical protein
MLALAFAKKVLGVVAMHSQLGEQGRANFAVYRQVADGFDGIRGGRLQFLTYLPDVLRVVEFHASVPETAYTALGIDKAVFLDFMGFEHLCKISDFYAKAYQLDQYIARLTTEGADDRLIADYREFHAELLDKFHNPKILRGAGFLEGTALLKSVMSVNTSARVSLAFEYPSWIWMARHEIPDHLVPKGKNFGKWIVHADLSTLGLIAKKLLGPLDSGEIGTVKFSAALRPSGVASLLVYASNQSSQVRTVLQLAAGQSPFWVPDEYCFEAQALNQLIADYLIKCHDFRAVDKLSAFQIEVLLQQDAFCLERQISDLQRELMLRMLRTDRSPSAKNAIDFIYDTYIGGNEKVDIDGNPDDSWTPEIVCVALSVLISDGEKANVGEHLAKSRQNFRRIYHIEG